MCGERAGEGAHRVPAGADNGEEAEGEKKLSHTPIFLGRKIGENDALRAR